MPLVHRTSFSGRHNSLSSLSSRDREGSFSRSSSDGIPPSPASVPLGASLADLERGAGRDARGRGGRAQAGRPSRFLRCLALAAIVVLGGYTLVARREQNALLAQIREHDAALRDLEIDLTQRHNARVRQLTDEKSRLLGRLSDSEEMSGRNRQLKEENDRLQAQATECAEGRRSIEDQARQVEELENKVREAEAAHGELEARKNELEAASGQLAGRTAALKEQRDTVTGERDKLQRGIQLMSKTAVLEKFGAGPHQAELHVAFNNPEERGVVLIELAPVDDLPHAVHWFLEQASRGLFDGFSFHHNAGHVLVAGPLPNFLSPAGFQRQDAEQRFRDAGFDKLQFSEYASTFPHAPYTLGYTGRPGGPRFYVSLKDNTKVHGPGGQGKDAAPETCFAKVVEGRDVVDRIARLPEEEGHFVDAVAIERVTLRRS